MRGISSNNLTSQRHKKFRPVCLICSCYVCHIRHIRPHSPFPIPLLPPSRRSPHLSLDCPSLPCLSCCWPICTCVTQLTLARGSRASFLNRPIRFIHSSRHCRHYIDWLESEIRLLNLAAAVQLLLKNSYYNGTVSDVLLVGVQHCNYDIGGRLTTGETVVLSRRRRARRLSRVPAAIRVCWTIRDTLSNKLFIVVLVVVVAEL